MAWSITYVLMCELGHFLLAFFAGMIAWLLMKAIYNRLYSAIALTSMDTSPGPVTRVIMSHSGTFIFVMAIAVAMLSHVLEDYYFSIV